MLEPGHGNGPFIEPRRRRWFGRGGNDPTSPATYTGVAPSVPSGRSSTRPASPTSRTPRQHGLARRIVGWVIRAFGLRLALAGVALVLVLIGSVADHDEPAVSSVQVPTPLPATAAPSPGDTPSPGSTGREVVTVRSVAGSSVAVEDFASRTYVWRVDAPAVRRLLVARRGQGALLEWRHSGAAVVVDDVDFQLAAARAGAPGAGAPG